MRLKRKGDVGGAWEEEDFILGKRKAKNQLKCIVDQKKFRLLDVGGYGKYHQWMKMEKEEAKAQTGKERKETLERRMKEFNRK